LTSPVSGGIDKFLYSEMISPAYPGNNQRFPKGYREKENAVLKGLTELVPA
jgi:hypothetical protein